MSRGYRNKIGFYCRVAIAVLGTALWVAFIWNMSASQTRGEIEAEYAARDYAESAEQHIADVCTRGSIASRADCVRKAIESSRENQRGERDVQAQETMARWTLVMGFAATVGLALSIVGVVLIYTTFQATRDSAEAASSAAEAAWRALSATNQSTQAMYEANAIMREADRPWVAIQFELTKFVVKDDWVSFAYVARFSNIGNTIARNLRAYAGMKFTTGPIAGEVDNMVQQWGLMPKEHGPSLMPGESLEHWGANECAYDTIPWVERGGTKRVFLVASGIVNYDAPSNAGIISTRATQRTFTLAKKSVDPTKQLMVADNTIWSLCPENVVILQSQPWGTT